MEPGTLLLLVGGILAVSMAVAIGAARVGVPTLVAFLALGMLLIFVLIATPVPFRPVL